jgi:alanine-glyoxylate transaminase/serine-glyoxylate transaminase/serine-pyruvate transaminase
MSERDLLMIPGPITFDPAVLRAMATPTASHVSAGFAEIFGEALEGLREIFLSAEGQPFVLAGSGTLAMDMAAANLIEPEDQVLVLNSGYFSDRMVAICQRYGARVTEVKAPLGEVPPRGAVEGALAERDFKIVAMTHVDTSTGVAVDVQATADLARSYGAMTIVDGVCATGGMTFHQDDWGVDICLTASQKALGVPPGLALLMVSPRALQAYKARKSPVPNYYADFGNWLPIMEAYLARKPSYFGTPPVNLIYALRESVRQILAEGMEARFRRHRLISDAFKAGMAALGLRQVPVRAEFAAETLTAPYYPDGVDASFLGKVRSQGVVLAGGLHPQIRDRYFRVGHMGAVTSGDLLATVGAIEWGLARSGYPLKAGAGVAATQEVLQKGG